METDTDLRTFIQVMIRHWRLVVGAIVATAMVTLIVSLLMPPKYEATALTLITRPLYQFQFSTQIQNLESVASQQLLTGKAAFDLATSDLILEQLLNKIGHSLQDQERSLTPLKENLVKAKVGSDPTVLKLIVTYHDPEVAARIANTWAELYVQHVNDLYSQPTEQQTFFESQWAQAKTDLDKADQALVDFQKRNNAAVLKAQLAAKQSALTDYLNMHESLKLLRQNVRNLQDQLARQPSDTPSSLGDDLAALSFQVDALNAQPGTLVQVQLPITGSLSNKTVRQQATYLAELGRTIEAQQAESKKQADALPADIMSLQSQLEEINAENARLTNQRTLAQTVYTTLSQKVIERRMASQDSVGRMRLASYAVVPDRPIIKPPVNTALGAVAGLVLGCLGAFALEYFKQFRVTKPAPRPLTVPGSK